MKAEIGATAIKVQLEFSQRELELFHALMSHCTGFKAEELSKVPASASEFTAILYALSAAARSQVRSVESTGRDDSYRPIEREVCESR